MAVANVSNSPIVGDRHDGGAMLAVAEVALHLDLLDMVDKAQYPDSLYCHWNILVAAPRLELFRDNLEEIVVDFDFHA